MKRLNNSAGFTLLEVLIAMIVLAIGIVSVSAFSRDTTLGNALSKNMTVATMLSGDKLENIRSLSYASIDAQAGTENYGTIAGYSNFKRVTAVTVDSPDTGMKTVTVTTYWDTGAHNVVLQTILADGANGT